MCIAIYSLKGNEIPKEEYLKNSFIANDDGAGFAFNTDDHKVRIVKGLMTWDAFIDTFRKYEKKYGFKDRGVLIHFRITTHGGTNPECTHPFPIVADEGIMHKLEYVTDYACIHNGVIQLTSTEAFRRNKMSDTMVFVEKYLTKIATNKRWFKNDTNFELLYDLLDSKMAILNGYGEIKSTSGFTKDKDGNYYSNTSYKEERVKISNYNSWDYYDGYYGNYYNNLSDKKIDLMKLEKGDILLLDNFEDCTYEDDIDYFITENNDCFLTPKIGDKRSKYVYKDISYIGEGMICDKYYKEIPFKPTNYTYKSDLEECFDFIQDEFEVWENELESKCKKSNKKTKSKK